MYDVRCSWAASLGASTVLHTFVEENGFDEAEAAVQSAMEAGPSSCAASLLPVAGGGAAPWVSVALSAVGVVALGIVCNARVIEVYDGDGGGAPLLTTEAQRCSDAATLFAHFLCHGDNEKGVLLLPHHSYRLKLFARAPKDVVSLARICLVVRQQSEGSGAASTALEPRTTAPWKTEQPVEGILLQLQQLLVAMELRFSSSTASILHRLDVLEKRVQHIDGRLDCIASKEETEVTSTAPGVTDQE